MQTLLGWVINRSLQGNNVALGENGHQTTFVNRIDVDRLEELLITQYNQDFSEKFANDKEEMSVEEKKFMEIMGSSVQLKDGHYMIKLPFKNKNVNMPNNISVARQCVRSLRQKLQKDAIFHKEYSNFLSDMIIKGYAEEVHEHQLERAEVNVGYLPHHGVFHPQKGVHCVTLVY